MLWVTTDVNREVKARTSGRKDGRKEGRRGQINHRRGKAVREREMKAALEDVCDTL